MKNLKTLKPLLVCSLSPLFLFSHQAIGQDDESDIFELSAFTVEADSDLGYRKTVASTATKIGTSILETPLNISVVASELIEDLARDNTVDLFNYTSSVKVSYDVPVGLSPGTADNGFKIRGFSTTFAYQDGVRRPQGFYVDGIDRVEVVKGPVGLYFGRTEPGGIVNFVSKRPMFINETRIKLSYGSYEYFKGMLDHQGVIVDDKVAYRLVTSKRESDDWQDYVTWDETYILGTVTYRPMKNMEISVQYETLDQFRTGGRVSGLVANLDYNALLAADALPIGSNGLAQTKNAWIQEVFDQTGIAPRQFNGYAFPLGHKGNIKGPGAFDDIETGTFLTDFKWQIAQGLNLRAVFSDTESDSTTFWPLEQEIPRSPRVMTALATGGDPNSPTVINFGLFQTSAFNPTFPTAPGKAAPSNHLQTFQTDLSYEFDLPIGNHTIIGSFEWISDQGRSFGVPTDTEAFIRAGGIPGNAAGLGNDPYSEELNQILMAHRQKLVDWGLLGPTQGFPFGDRIFGAYYIDLALNPDIPDASQWVPNARTENSTSGSDSYERSLAVSYRGRFFGDKLTIMAGVRDTSYESVSASFTDGENSRSGDWEEFSDVTPTYGVSYALRPDLMLYSSYSETFLPTGRNINQVITNTGTGETLGGDFTSPEKGEGYEIGIKSALWDYKLSGTLTYFSLSRASLIISDPLNTTLREENEALILAGQDPVWVDEDGAPIAQGNGAGLRRNGGEEEVGGVELEFIYTPIRNFQIITAITNYMTREIVVPDPSIINVLNGGEFAPNPNDGRDAYPLDPLENVPEWMFSTWMKYTFIEGPLADFSFGFGGNYQSEEVHETRNNNQFEAFTTGSWWRFDLMLGYKLEVYGRPMSLQFNVNNLFDEEYVTGSFGPAPTRTWRLSATYEF